MKFTQFIDLPTQLKNQLINKCTPFSYVRLRRTCRFVDEFCEKYRKRLGVYCPKDEFYIGLEHIDFSYYVFLRNANDSVYITLTPDSMVKINKALSGFIFAELWLNNFRKNYDSALEYFTDAVPDFKVSLVQCFGLTAEQVERVVSSQWKIGGVEVASNLEMWKILQIDAKMDTLFCYWGKNNNDFTEQDIVQLAHGKKRMELDPQFLSTTSRLNVLKAIAQSWQSDGHFPSWFRMTWDYGRTYMDVDISGLSSEIMVMEACHLGSFSEDENIRYDVWIGKDNKTWQFVTIKRTYRILLGVEAEFIFESTESTAEFVQKMTKFLQETQYVVIFNASSLHEACLTENMEKIKEAFVNFFEE